MPVQLGGPSEGGPPLVSERAGSARSAVRHAQEVERDLRARSARGGETLSTDLLQAKGGPP